jgi:hypothetical protein
MRNVLFCSLTLFGCAAGDPDGMVGPSPDPSDPRPTVAIGNPTLEVDFDQPDPDTNPVTVRVERGGSPVADVTVVLHGADGAVTSVTATRADGSAVGPVEAGSFATIAYQQGTNKNAVTIAGVDPGDEVTFVLPAPTIDPTVGSVRARLPGAATNASTYTLDVGCAAETVTNPSPPYTLAVRESCLTGASETANVFATAYDASGSPVSWTFSGDVAIDASAATSVNLPSWSQSWQQVQIQVTDAPAGARSILLGAEWSVAEGTFPAADEPSAVVSSGASVTLSTRVPSMAAQGFTSRIIVGHGGASTLSGLSERIEQHDGVPTLVSLEMPSDFLPAITAPALDTSTPARPAVAWTAAASLANADVGRIALSWGDAGGSHQWIAFVPPSATAPVVMPALPEELADWRPSDGATYATPQVTFYQADWISGYDSVKASGFDAELPPGAHVLQSSAALNP